jgi:hypothetical protein
MDLRYFSYYCFNDHFYATLHLLKSVPLYLVRDCPLYYDHHANVHYWWVLYPREEWKHSLQVPKHKAEGTNHSFPQWILILFNWCLLLLAFGNFTYENSLNYVFSWPNHHRVSKVSESYSLVYYWNQALRFLIITSFHIG